MNARYYTLRQADLPALFDRARGDYDVIAKRRDANGNLCYGPATSFADVDFTAEQPRLSAKACAFPQIEELTRYRREGRTFTDATPAAPALRARVGKAEAAKHGRAATRAARPPRKPAAAFLSVTVLRYTLL